MPFAGASLDVKRHPAGLEFRHHLPSACMNRPVSLKSCEEKKLRAFSHYMSKTAQVLSCISVENALIMAPRNLKNLCLQVFIDNGTIIAYDTCHYLPKYARPGRFSFTSRILQF